MYGECLLQQESLTYCILPDAEQREDFNGTKNGIKYVEVINTSCAANST